MLILVSSSSAQQCKSDTTHPKSNPRLSRASANIQRHQSMSIASRLASRTAKEYFDSHRNSASRKGSRDGKRPEKANIAAGEPDSFEPCDDESRLRQSTHADKSEPVNGTKRNHFYNHNLVDRQNNAEQISQSVKVKQFPFGHQETAVGSCAEDLYIDSGFASEASHGIYCNITAAQIGSSQNSSFRSHNNTKSSNRGVPISTSTSKDEITSTKLVVSHTPVERKENQNNFVNRDGLSFYSSVRRQRLSQSSKGTNSSADSRTSKEDIISPPENTTQSQRSDNTNLEELLDGRGLFSCASKSPLYFSKMRLTKQQKYYANHTRKSL